MSIAHALELFARLIARRLIGLQLVLEQAQHRWPPEQEVSERFLQHTVAHEGTQTVYIPGDEGDVGGVAFLASSLSGRS